MSRRQEINGILLMLSLFIPSLTIPLKQFMQNGISVWVLTFLILIVSIYLDNLYINKKFLFTFIIINVLFFINILLVNYKDIVSGIYLEFLVSSAVALYLSFKQIDYKRALKSGYVMAVLTIVIWFLYLDLVIDRELSYMFFGSSMMLSFALIFHRLIEKKKLIDLILVILSFLLIAIFANRGAILASILIIIILLYYKVKIKTIFTFGGLCGLLLLFLLDFKLILMNIVNKVNDLLLINGVNSYAMTKFSNMFIDGLAESSSGRDGLYSTATNLLSEGLLPRGIGYFQYVTSLNYPHNFILDVLLIFGFLGIPLILAAFWYLISFFIYEKNQLKKELILILLLITIVRLSLSSTFLYETTFWVILGITLNNETLSLNNNFDRLKKC